MLQLTIPTSINLGSRRVTTSEGAINVDVTVDMTGYTLEAFLGHVGSNSIWVGIQTQLRKLTLAQIKATCAKPIAWNFGVKLTKIDPKASVMAMGFTEEQYEAMVASPELIKEFLDNRSSK
jgi:nucleoside permease NupC